VYNSLLKEGDIIRYTLRILAIVSAIILAAFSVRAEEFSADYHKKVLDNGATIVSRYMPESPLVVVQIRVLSGLSNEGEYASSGISHFLEHLLFKGTHVKTSEEIRREIKAMGGMVNGSTGLDSAEYHITVPNENFEKTLSLLVSVVMDPVFTEEEVETERDVILKEIKLRNDDPVARRMRLLFSQAYREHVYKYPIMGYEEMFKKLLREDLIHYHSAVYTPDRIVIGIAGGIPPERALEAAEKEFGEYQRGKPWPVDVSPEPRQIDENKSEFPADTTLGYLAMGFHTTSVYSPDLYAGDVLGILLGEGNDSRLYRRLVKEKQLLYTVSSGNYTPKYPGLFVITGIGDPDKLEQAREEIFAVIDELKKGQVQEGEVERARNLVISDYFRSHERIASITSAMTSSQILTGDPAFFEKYVHEIKKVGKEKVEEAASRYLTRDNSTTVFLMPRDYQVEAGPAKAGQKVEEEEKEMTLANGLRIIVKRKGQLPLVSVTLAIPGGLRAEERGDNGISNLTAAVLLKGTKKRNESEIIPVMERMGGSIGTFSGMNSIGVSMDVLSGDLSAGLDIFEDVVKNAVFPEEELAKEKKKVIASIKEEESDIFENGMFHFRRLLYGDHPYAMRLAGEVRTIDPISRDEIISFYRKHFVPENAVMTVVGDINMKKTLDNLVKRFGGWRGKSSPLREKEVVPLKKERQEDVIMRKEQFLLLVGFQGVRVSDKRKYALDIISSILSGSDGLLFYALREEEGLTYASGAVSVPAVDPGYFVLYAATTEENIGKVEKMLLDTIKKVTSGDITEEEIRSSKNRLISQHAYSLETNSSISMTMALGELYGLGFRDYKRYPAEIGVLEKDDIVKYAREVLDLNRRAVVVVRPE
jgi:zinc protease